LAFAARWTTLLACRARATSRESSKTQVTTKVEGGKKDLDLGDLGDEEEQEEEDDDEGQEE